MSLIQSKNLWKSIKVMRYFITGHTGFKGAWYALQLHLQGHEVFGFALDPLKNGIFESARVKDLLTGDIRGDVRDSNLLKNSIRDVNPDIVVHMAAQPLVSLSYQNPTETFEVNVGGTLNLLNACLQAPAIKSIAVVTTDKVYMNIGEKRAFVEEDPLGLGDPYSTSKAMADLLVQSWMKDVTVAPVVILRAGNVLGGGDVSPNRLIPDLVRSIRESTPALLRNPNAVRPWQHVLDCLFGYQKAIDWSVSKRENLILNFGPDFNEYRTVGEVAKKYFSIANKGSLEITRDVFPKEAEYLTLDSSKARTLLNWSDKLDLDQTLKATESWYRNQDQGLDMQTVSINQS